MKQSTSDEEEADWEITADGLYMATRGLLTRRGYCCANQCRNCPYINWRANPAWQPVPHEYVHTMHVSAKAVAAAQTQLQWHREQLHKDTDAEREQHQMMIEHYNFLLAQWGNV